jgi:vacuolar protein sorting-associated protein 53
MIMMDFD